MLIKQLIFLLLFIVLINGDNLVANSSDPRNRKRSIATILVNLGDVFGYDVQKRPSILPLTPPQTTTTTAAPPPPPRPSVLPALAKQFPTAPPLLTENVRKTFSLQFNWNKKNQPPNTNAASTTIPATATTPAQRKIPKAQLYQDYDDSENSNLKDGNYDGIEVEAPLRVTVGQKKHEDEHEYENYQIDTPEYTLYVDDKPKSKNSKSREYTKEQFNKKFRIAWNKSPWVVEQGYKYLAPPEQVSFQSDVPVHTEQKRDLTSTHHNNVKSANNVNNHLLHYYQKKFNNDAEIANRNLPTPQQKVIKIKYTPKKSKAPYSYVKLQKIIERGKNNYYKKENLNNHFTPKVDNRGNVQNFQPVTNNEYKPKTEDNIEEIKKDLQNVLVAENFKQKPNTLESHSYPCKKNKEENHEPKEGTIVGNFQENDGKEEYELLKNHKQDEPIKNLEEKDETETIIEPHNFNEFAPNENQEEDEEHKEAEETENSGKFQHENQEEDSEEPPQFSGASEDLNNFIKSNFGRYFSKENDELSGEKNEGDNEEYNSEDDEDKERYENEEDYQQYQNNQEGDDDNENVKEENEELIEHENEELVEPAEKELTEQNEDEEDNEQLQNEEQEETPNLDEESEESRSNKENSQEETPNKFYSAFDQLQQDPSFFKEFQQAKQDFTEENPKPKPYESKRQQIVHPLYSGVISPESLQELQNSDKPVTIPFDFEYSASNVRQFVYDPETEATKLSENFRYVPENYDSTYSYTIPEPKPTDYAKLEEKNYNDNEPLSEHAYVYNRELGLKHAKLRFNKDLIPN